MGFEQTLSEYREAKKQLTGGSVEDQEFIQAMALQKAWADRMCELLLVQSEDEREVATVDTMEKLGGWFRQQVMEFPTTKEGVSRKQYYLQLFDQDPHRAVEELYQLYRQGLQ